MAVPRRHRIRRRLSIAAAVVVALLVAASVAIAVVYSGRVLPGTEVAGVDLGGATAKEARARMSAVVSPDRPVRVVGGARELIVRPGEAGYEPDVDATVERAMRAGRREGLASFATRLLWIVDPEPVEVAATIDRSAFARINAAIDRAASRPAFPGGLVIDPTTLDVSTTPARAGVAVERRGLARRLRLALEGRARRVVRVPTQPVPVPPPAALAAVAQEAEEYLRSPLRIGSVSISPARLAKSLAVVASRDARSARLGTTRRGRAALGAFVARAVDRPVREATISAPARPVVLDAKGEVSWRQRRGQVSVRPSATGRVVRQKALAAAIDAAVQAGRHSVEPPVRRIAPKLSTEAARDARFLIGTFTTRYAPGEPRVRNIRRIARAVDGTVVRPGERFSLNQTSGPRTRAKGYVKAPFIADGKIVPSVGGGVSQFSTTMYNAAYFAGLRLDAHQPHSLYIDRYPPGREATLNFPDIDLVWTNDTDSLVLVRTFSDETSVTVSLYGANGGRRVRAQAGARRRLEEEDFEITVTRVIRYAGGRIERQPVTTQYDRPRDDP